MNETDLSEIDADVSDLSGGRRFVLFLTLNRNDPTTKDIEAATGFASSHVREILTELKRAGLIEPVPNPAEPRCHFWQPTVGLKSTPSPE